MSPTRPDAEPPTARESTGDRPTRRTAEAVGRALGRGAVGGLVATAQMTLYRTPVFRALPPTADVWSRYVAGGEPEDHRVAGLLLHLLYGTVAGGVFGPAFAAVDGRTPLSRDQLGVVAGLGYGLLLSVFGTRVVLPTLTGADLDDERTVFHVGHVVYGLTLGTWVAARRRLGEVYD